MHVKNFKYTTNYTDGYAYSQEVFLPNMNKLIARTFMGVGLGGYVTKWHRAHKWERRIQAICLFCLFVYLEQKVYYIVNTLLSPMYRTIALGFKTQDRPWEPDFHWGPFAISPRQRAVRGRSFRYIYLYIKLHKIGYSIFIIFFIYFYYFYTIF